MRIDNNMAGVSYLDSRRRNRKKVLNDPDPPSGLIANFSSTTAEPYSHHDQERKDNPKKYVHKRAVLEKVAYALVKSRPL